MNCFEIDRKDFLKSFLPCILNTNPNDGQYIENFCRNSNCQFWIAKKDEQICGLMIANLMYGKLEIYRFYDFLKEKYCFLSFIELFKNNPEISGIAVFQNLKAYFPILEGIGFQDDADITMALDAIYYIEVQTPVLSFEPVEDRHSEFIFELKKICYINDFYQRLVHKNYIDTYCRDSVREVLEGGSGFIGVANNAYVGAVFWRENDDPEIIDIMVHIRMQGRGYGKALLQKVIMTLKAKDARSIKVGVFESNYPARNLYLGAGFQEVERLKLMSWKR